MFWEWRKLLHRLRDGQAAAHLYSVRCEICKGVCCICLIGYRRHFAVSVWREVSKGGLRNYIGSLCSDKWHGSQWAGRDGSAKAMIRKKIIIMCLQETKWIGQKDTTSVPKWLSQFVRDHEQIVTRIWDEGSKELENKFFFMFYYYKKR